MLSTQDEGTEYSQIDVHAHTVTETDEPLDILLRTLALQGYKFTTVTPLTHARFLKRSDGVGKNLEDIFGWNLPFRREALPSVLFDVLNQANLLSIFGDAFKSKVRVSSLNEHLFLHSEYPTHNVHSVFFGPDTYRFTRFIEQHLEILQLQTTRFSWRNPVRILDVGCGSGAGGILTARILAENKSYALCLNDTNSLALEYARLCAKVAEISAEFLHDDFFNIKDREFDFIVSNPPYISDKEGYMYRDGGDKFGLELSLKIVTHALRLLAPGGRLLLYTGVAMTDASNPLLRELSPQMANPGYQWSYEEIDPDIFGEELEEPQYRGVHRIAAVGLVVVRQE